MDPVGLMRPVTKFSAGIESADTINEVVANAFRIAESGRPGATYINARQDIMVGDTHGEVLTPVIPASPGSATAFAIAEAAALINHAQRPVLFPGLLASQPDNAQAVRELLSKARLSERELHVNTIGFLAHDMVILLDPTRIVENLHDAYTHSHFLDKAYSLLMSGPSGSADIGGVSVHPAQGVMTLTVIFWPDAK